MPKKEKSSRLMGQNKAPGLVSIRGLIPEDFLPAELTHQIVAVNADVA
jgi:hypothetical protein